MVFSCFAVYVLANNTRVVPYFFRRVYTYSQKVPLLKLRVVINTAKKETPHSFKGQQLEDKLVYRFVIYMMKFLALV